MSLLSHEHHPTTFLIPCNDDTLNNVASNKFYYKDGKIYKDFESFTAPNSPSHCFLSPAICDVLM